MSATPGSHSQPPLSADARVLCGRLGIGDDWLDRWGSLSGGEQKRAQIAAALWQSPDVLAVDEPTNHIDAAARGLLAAALRDFAGVGLLVSHDRALLDDLCRQCLFVRPPQALLRGGGYTQATRQLDLERSSAQAQRDQLRREETRLRREAARRREEASRSHRQRSKRGLAIKDHDARGRINRARVSGKDSVAGKQLNQMLGRLDQTRDRLADSRVEKARRLGMSLQGETSARNFLFRTGPGELAMGPDRRLRFGELSMAGDDRVAIVGPNGSGKSTLIRHVVQVLARGAEAASGDAGALDVHYPAEGVIVLPQEISLEASRQILAEVRRLPAAQLGEVMAAVASLGSEPQRVLQTEAPSPGELRKVLLALGLARKVHLIVMDEPTNHLDLPSIECLEAALADCQAALLLVSHDLRFLEALARTFWAIEPDGDDSVVTVAAAGAGGGEAGDY